jgi:hypothetical protein
VAIQVGVMALLYTDSKRITQVAASTRLESYPGVPRSALSMHPRQFVDRGAHLFENGLSEAANLVHSFTNVKRHPKSVKTKILVKH